METHIRDEDGCLRPADGRAGDAEGTATGDAEGTATGDAEGNPQTEAS